MMLLLLKAGKEQDNMEFDLKLQQFVDWKVYNVRINQNHTIAKLTLNRRDVINLPVHKLL